MESHNNALEDLSKRYIELRELNKKTHLCGFWFRQRCLKTQENCQFAHGISDLKRIPSCELLELRQELFNIKQKLKTLKYAIIYNWKKKKHEIYKVKDLKALKQSLKSEDIDIDEEDLEEVEDEGEGQDGEESKREGGSGFPKVKRCIALINFEECHEIEEIESKYHMNKFDMNKALDSDDEINMIKRKPRNAAERAIITPWQNEVMAKFLMLLFEEVRDGIYFKSTIVKKFNEAGVPLTWSRLCLTKVHFEKKIIMPPFNINTKVTIVLPLYSSEENLQGVEAAISQVLIDKACAQKENFSLPVRLAEIQKEYQLNLKPKEPPLFVITKQLETDMDSLFYKILEQRNNIKNQLISYLKQNASEQEWSDKLIETLNSEETYLFMPFSHESYKAREMIEHELSNKISINSILEQGKFNDYISTRYFSYVKNSESFEKIVNTYLQKHDYKILRVGSGNFLINQMKFSEESEVLFSFENKGCPYCNEEAPDADILKSLIEDECKIYGQLEFLEYFEDKRILIVNNYNSLRICYQDLMNQTSLGVDLEGRLGIGGSINLIQVGCEKAIYIFDIFQVKKLNKDDNLLSMMVNVLKAAFLDKNIRKVFFDCKKDIEALHYVLGIGIQNVFDAQPVHMALTQFKEFQKNRKIFELKHTVTPGLNDVLSKHEVSHGVNSLKTKFKKIFNDPKQITYYFGTRPLDPEFASYSAQDVEDLSELALLLEAKLETVLEKGISPKYRELLVSQLCQSYSSKACQKYYEVYPQLEPKIEQQQLQQM